jgi:hypothetical protein
VAVLPLPPRANFARTFFARAIWPKRLQGGCHHHHRHHYHRRERHIKKAGNYASTVKNTTITKYTFIAGFVISNNYRYVCTLNERTRSECWNESIYECIVCMFYVF